MKKFVCMALIVLIAVFSVVPAYADTVNTAEIPGAQGEISPLFTYISFMNAGLSIDSSGLATCLGNVILYNSSNSTTLTVQLQKSTGSGWKTIKTWTTSAISYADIEGYYFVASGTYRVCTTAQVYNSSGYLVETESIYSPTKTY